MTKVLKEESRYIYKMAKSQSKSTLEDYVIYKYANKYLTTHEANVLLNYIDVLFRA